MSIFLRGASSLRSLMSLRSPADPAVKSWVRFARPALLAALVALGWCVATGRLSARAWHTPLSYAGDALLILARIHSAAEGRYWPLLPKRIPALGAPFGATWDGHPTSEDWLYTLSGLAARPLGLGLATNLAVVMSFVLAALSAYLSCRMLRCRWEWSFLCALAFAWSPYAFFRGLGHVMLAYDWLIPLGALVGIWLITQDEAIRRTKGLVLALLVAFVTGWHNTYYTFLFLQWVALAGAVLAVRRRSWRALFAPAAIAGCAVLGWSLANVDSLPFLFAHRGGAITFFRSRADLARYALRPLSLFVPLPGHRWSFWEAWGTRYRAGLDADNEAIYSYLGLLGIGALIWLAGTCALAAFRRPRRPWPVQAWLILWVVLFSVPGGVNGLLGRAGLTFFRATNRYSIAILALALLFFAQRLTVLGERWPAWRRMVCFALLGLLVIGDQLLRPAGPAQIDAIAAQMSSDRAFVAAMQQRIPAGGMVFQLPIFDFPEAPAQGGMTGYEHLRPYLFAHGLRFSYGDHKSDFAASWQNELAELPPEQMLATLEGHGFSAIQLNRAGYADRGRAVIEALRRSGRDQVIESPAGDLVAILLHPSQQPRLPEVTMTFGRGWYPPERDATGRVCRWTSGNALMTLLNTTGAPITRTLAVEVATLGARHLRVRQAGNSLVDVELAPGPSRRLAPTTVTLEEEVTTLEWLTDEPAVVPSGTDLRKLAIRVYSPCVTKPF
jgi:hypothetical protein